MDKDTSSSSSSSTSNKDQNKKPASTEEEDEKSTLKGPVGTPKHVIVHPLVLLSVVDHYHRVLKHEDESLKKRVCGILLGKTSGNTVECTNSYAVPFEEDPHNPKTWYFDHNYHEAMFAMFKKVNASEKIVGWYSTGPLIRPADIEIHEVIRRYCPQPVMVIVDVRPQEVDEAPTKAYYSTPTMPDAHSSSRQEFVHIASSIGAEEAEEVGVEHLLREIKDVRVSTISDIVSSKIASLRALDKRMHLIYEYLDNVTKNKLPPNPSIINLLQDIFNFATDMSREDLAAAFSAKTHDSLLVMYVASLIRAVISLHELINNKFLNRAAERSAEQKRALLAAQKRLGDNEGDNLMDEAETIDMGGEFDD